MKKSYFKNLSLVFLAAAIALSPSFSAGEIEGGRVLEIRIEDVLIVILGLVWIASFLISGRKNIKKPPLFLPILAWLGIGFFSVLTNWIFMNIELSRGFFYFLKEVEFFFLYFYLFYHIRNLDTTKFTIKIWIFLGLINVGWVIYQIIKGLVPSGWGAYGPGAVGEAGPFPSGGFFLILFIFLFNILFFYYLNLNISKFKKGILTVVIISPSIGVFSSGSRASFLGFILALILTFLFYSLKKGFLKSFLIGILALIIISSFFIFFQQSTAERFLNIEGILWNLNPENPVSRTSIWITQLTEASKHPLFLFFGLGKSVFLTTEESHSQYVRNFIETGIIGSLVFFLLIFAIIKKTFQGFSLGKDTFSIGLSAGLLVSTLVILFVSIVNDAFIIVKVMEVYWFFTALTMATLSFKLGKSKERIFN